MSEKEDFYIKLLKFCSNLEGEFTYSDLKDSDIIVNDWEKDIIDTYLDNAIRNKRSLDNYEYSNYETIFWCTSRGSDRTTAKYIMNYDAKFKYIDYQELNEARNMSKQALITSIVAIFVAILTLATSIIFSIKTLNHPIEINTQQFQEIKALFNK